LSRPVDPERWVPSRPAVTLGEGFDFVGFTIRRYHGKLLIKPSKAAVKRIRGRLRAELRSLRGANAQAVIARLNPIIRGWSAYYRTVVSSHTFTALDHYLWKLTYKWAKHSHANKPARWIVRRYFGKFCTPRNDRWVFGDRDSGAYLPRFAWTKISGTRWSGAPRPATTLPWPATGPTDGEREYPGRWISPACASCRRNTAGVRCAGNCSWTLTARRKPRASGNSGWRSLARR
jgi:hypothetical protein